ncbi:hypothetical protein EOD39_8879 [Acipenser ruthenus]|uniref:Uncharacterized protein n=1 Tax=Acipenser ruthenus TaxID=7906 RepID=A0A662YW02_ACIRT|nr:hypothetical protein EOD39_8879 [Acipenser ruthenus]
MQLAQPLMGRLPKHPNPVRHHFKYDPGKDSSQCQIQNCKVTITGNHAANLERQVQQFHSKYFKAFCEEKAGKRKAEESLSGGPSKKVAGQRQQTLDCLLAKLHDSSSGSSNQLIIQNSMEFILPILLPALNHPGTVQPQRDRGIRRAPPGHPPAVTHYH